MGRSALKLLRISQNNATRQFLCRRYESSVTPDLVDRSDEF
jgi:hypothetical protein